ncbi:unnamed protein product [Mytilus coruscus]|uniref:Novel STAND NTPase 3 domain-containing protein n=1 Tax=Mytilus coruscus TaxID=42192 RepID=A0A6J8BCY6_MYTCO|nr:unnamed protein product [Mytilus coruscus]
MANKGWDHPTAPCLTEVTAEFKNIADRLEKYLRKHRGEYVDKFVDLETCCMDEKTSDMYIRRIERLKKSDEDCKKRIHAVEKDVYALKEKSTSQTEELENTAKQLDALELKEEVHGKKIKDLQVNQQSQTEELENTAKQLDALELKEEVHGKKIKDLQVNQQSRSNRRIGEYSKTARCIRIKRGSSWKEDKRFTSQAEGLEKTATEHSNKLDECKMETNKIRKVQTQHIERFENLEQKTESLKLKEEVHGKEIKDLQENLQDICPKDLKRRKIYEITLPESFEKIKEVNKGADALRDNDIVILVGIKGSGKSTIGKAIIKQYCEENPDYDMIQLSTTTKSDIILCDGLGFFCFSNQVVVFLDDLFGRVPSTYAFKEHLMLLKWVYEKQDGIKILSTVQAETKACVEELFASDHGDALLISAEIINLHSTIYPRRDMLIKSGFNEESSDSIIRQLKETAVQERIGFPALVSIYKENQELGDELFINPGNVFMKYLSSLKEGSDHDKMYFVILIHVLMTGKVHETQNTSDKESMCHIATTIFGNTLEFQKYDSSIESIIDEKEDGILMNINGTFDPYYCFKDEITPDFIFQYYKAEGIEKILTTCSLNCIVSYFRPFTVADEPLICIDSSLYQKVASHIITIIKEDLKTPSSCVVFTSAKTLCMSPLLQDENFLNALMNACDQLSIHIYAQTVNVKLGYDKNGTLKVFHLPSVLLHQSCRQLSMMYSENVKVVKTIFLKLCHTGEKEDSLAVEEKEEFCQTINTLVKFSMEELCKDNIDKNVVLELLWKFIMDKKVDCKYNNFLMNAWRNQCSKTVIWLQENIREPDCLQIEQCFPDICCFGDVHKASWIFDQNPKSGQNKISMYKVFNKALERRPDLLDYMWKWEERILEDYKQDEQLHADASTANVKKNIANMVMEIALKEVHLTSELFRWACDTFKPHKHYFDKTTIKKIEREKTGKDLNSLFFN